MSVRTEFDAAVEDTNEARKRDPEDDTGGEEDYGAQMVAPVPGPTPAESKQSQQVAKPKPKPSGTEKREVPAAKETPVAKKARTTGSSRMGTRRWAMPTGTRSSSQTPSRPQGPWMVGLEPSQRTAPVPPMFLEIGVSGATDIGRCEGSAIHAPGQRLGDQVCGGGEGGRRHRGGQL